MIDTCMEILNISESMTNTFKFIVTIDSNNYKLRVESKIHYHAISISA